MNIYNLTDLIIKYNNKAIAAINVSNMEGIMAVLEVASEMNEPIILQVSPIEVQSRKISYDLIVKLIKIIGENYDVDIAIHLDHAPDFSECKKAIDAGFTSVMFDGSHLSYEKNVEISKEVVAYATQHHVSVEAELGKVGGVEGSNENNEDYFLTKVSDVKDFLQKTEVNLLAVAIGNAHGFYQGIPNIRVDRLKEINEITAIPLVLHGGTGISDETLLECIDNGIRKINVFTEVDSAYVQSFYNEVANNNGIYMMNASEKSRQEMMKVIRKKVAIISKRRKL